MDDQSTGALTPASDDSFNEAIKAGKETGLKMQEAGKESAAKIDAAAASTKQEIAGLEGVADRLQPPVMQPIPPPQPKSTSPIQEWGSLAMIFAGLGGLLTRTPATTALNAGAAALNAYKQKDQAAADRAFKTWEIASKNAIEQHNYQSEVYKAILDKIGHKEDLAEKQFTMDTAAAKTEFEATAKALSDPFMAQLMAVKGPAAVADALAKRDAAATKMQAAQVKVTEQKAFMDAQREIVQTPEWKNADAIGKLRMTYQLLDKNAPSQDTRGSGDPKDIQAAKTVYNLTYMPDGVTLDPKAPPFLDWYKKTWPNLFKGSGAAGYEGTTNPAGQPSGAKNLQDMPDPLGLR